MVITSRERVRGDAGRRTAVAVAALSVLAAGAGAGCERNQGRGPAPAAAPARMALDVQGMTCASCEAAIQHEVSRLPGVREVRASHTEKRAWVVYDAGEITAETIIGAINKLGYRASRARPPSRE